MLEDIFRYFIWHSQGPALVTGVQKRVLDNEDRGGRRKTSGIWHKGYRHLRSSRCLGCDNEDVRSYEMMWGDCSRQTFLEHLPYSNKTRQTISNRCESGWNLVYKSEQLFKLIFGILGRVNLYSVPAFAKFSANVEDRKHMPGVRRANYRDRKRVLLRGWQTIYMPRVIWIVHSPWPQIERIWKKMTVKRCQTSGLCTPSHSTDSLIGCFFPIDIK